MLDDLYKRGVLFVFILVVSLFFVNADVISINSGGDNEVIINPDKYIEGFFSGTEIVSGSCGNGIVEGDEICDDANNVTEICGDGSTQDGSYCNQYCNLSLSLSEECDDGNIENNDGCSSVCVTEVTSPAVGTSGGGGGGAGPTVQALLVEPETINLNLVVSTNKEQTISIKNLGSTKRTIEISQTNLDNMVILDQESITIGPSERRELKVIFVAPNRTGIFTGKILIDDREIFVALNIKTKLLLFDSNIVVLNRNYQVVKGDELRTEVTLIPMGDKDRLDVTLDYVIKDYDGRIYLTKKETLLITEQMDFRREFDTGSLPLGKYIVGLELIYPNGVAPSSAHFEVIEEKKCNWFLILIAVAMILLLILLILLLFYKRRKKKKKSKDSRRRSSRYSSLRNRWKSRRR